MCKYLDPYCFQFNAKKVCIECNDGYYINSTNRCAILPGQCLEVDVTTGLCQKCRDGYEFVEDRYQ